jgi:hypothetical protein
MSERFMRTAYDVLVVVKMSWFPLLCKLFKHQTGKSPDSAQDFSSVRLMLRDHIFMATTAIIVTCHILNVDKKDIYRLQIGLEKLTKIRTPVQNFFANLVLKGIKETLKKRT